MKMIMPLLFILGLLWFFSPAKAESFTNTYCNSEEECFHFDDEAVLPSMQLQQYPQYASLGNHFDTGGERTFVFSPRYKEWAAYDADGYRVSKGIANGGSDFCEDLGKPCHTPAGVYRVQSKGSQDCVSKKFPIGVGGAAMPYCMYFSGGYAIHGSPYISNRNGSHGCIRVHTSAAHWLHRYFMHPGTKVVVLPY